MIALLATLLFAGAAQAGTTVYHDFDGALRGIALDNACVTANSVETINDVRNCTKLEAIEHKAHSEHGMNYTEWVCKAWQVSKLAYPREFKRTVCTDYSTGHRESDSGGCLKTEEKTDFLPGTITISTVTELSLIHI